ncbi:MAG: ABC transporter permease [Cytophagales bacterium]|nr:ABC transporter permease [Cytophagales bacterium]
MLRNFFLVTVRNLRRNSLYSIINIAGLSIGIVCSVLIMLWVEDETTYDQFLPKFDRIHQVWVNAEFDDKINSWRSVPLPTYRALKTADNRIKNTCVAGWGSTRLLTVGDKRLIKEGYYVSDEFLTMFEYTLKQGTADQVLKEPNSIVITETLAQTLFPDEDPMGKIIKMEDQHLMQVTGILDDLPNNSTFQFEYLTPWKHREQVNDWVRRNTTNWGNYSFQVFVELYEASQYQEASAAIGPLLTENGQDDLPRTLFLHPMEKWRLFSNFEHGEATGGRSDFVQLFSIIATFILIIACINFMNLATARSEKRAREVGIRKSLGSKRTQLISQFLGESMFIATLAFVIAIILCELALPFYNDLVEKQLFINYQSAQFWLLSVGLICLTGLVSGSYPALFLSSFNTVRTLKGSVKLGKGASTPRKVLVIIQFSVSMLLMIGTVIIFRQINLVENRELGYDQQNLIQVEYTEELGQHYNTLKEELLQSGLAEAVTRSNSPITGIYSNNFLGWPGKPESHRVLFVTISAGYDYTETMGIDLLMGRDFDRTYALDSQAIIVNKAALDIMQLEDPIGTNLDLWGDKVKLIGVVDNVLMGSPYEPVRPMFMFMDPDWISYITVRLKKSDDLPETLAQVGAIFDQYNPAYPFEYEFADQEFQEKFSTIQLTKSLATLFSLLALFITGLGLFGLASYTAEQRIKEIGIRKVLGASVSGLITLLSRDFSKLVLISFAVAAPLSWWLMDAYLDRYAVRVPVEWWIFPIAGGVALLFALMIVSNHARKAALTNPVKSLRNE